MTRYDAAFWFACAICVLLAGLAITAPSAEIGEAAFGIAAGAVVFTVALYAISEDVKRE